MAISIAELRDLPREDLVELVADLWETRPGWRTVIVEPGNLEVEIEGETLEIVTPEIDQSRFPDVEVSVDLLAIQEKPYVELEYVHVRQAADADMVGETHFESLNQVLDGYRVRKSVIVTTGASPETAVDKRLYRDAKLVEGAELRDLIDQYSEYGFDHEEYL